RLDRRRSRCRGRGCDGRQCGPARAGSRGAGRGECRSCHQQPTCHVAFLWAVGRGGAFGFGPAENSDHLGSLARDTQQLPAALPHVGAPADQLLPLVRGRAEHPQVRNLLPLRGVRLRRQRHGEAGGRAISRVLFTRCLRTDGHLSGMAVASHLTRPTRSSDDPGRVSLLTWPCSDWGLPCRACCQARGGLLPHLFTLTLGSRAVCFLWPVPSPCGAQALPGSLPCGARTFLSAPLRPAHRDHHALPPPTGKGIGLGRVGASLSAPAVSTGAPGYRAGVVRKSSCPPPPRGARSRRSPRTPCVSGPPSHGSAAAPAP